MRSPGHPGIAGLGSASHSPPQPVLSSKQNPTTRLPESLQMRKADLRRGLPFGSPGHERVYQNSGLPGRASYQDERVTRTSELPGRASYQDERVARTRTPTGYEDDYVE